MACPCGVRACVWCACGATGGVCRVRVQCVCRVRVCCCTRAHLDHVALAQEDVVRLDVAVDDADLVDRVQCHEQLHAVAPQLRLVHVPVALLVGRDHGRQRAVGRVFHDHEELLRLDEAVVVAHDERMVERRQNVRLRHHRRCLLRVSGQLELLESVELVVGLAAGQLDGTAAAGTDLLHVRECRRHGVGLAIRRRPGATDPCSHASALNGEKLAKSSRAAPGP